MNATEAVVVVVEALESLSIPYMLVGSFSSSTYGVPRSTQDADFVLQMDNVTIGNLMERLGNRFKLDPQMSFETVTATHRWILKSADGYFKVELFLLSDDAHDRERFRRRQQIDTAGRLIWLPTPEDVIVTKLRWSRQGRRNKDVDDARNVIAIQGAVLDWPYVERWCDEHGTRELLEEIRRSIPT